MKENCQDELMALEKIETMPQSLLDADPEVTMMATAKVAALAVDWMGFKALVHNPVYRDTLKKLPDPEDDESDVDYIERIWPMLSADEQAVALDMGLQKMVTMKKLAETGVQLRIWRAFESGEWTYSPTGENDFRDWVRGIMVDVLESSSSEATKLANVCEAIAWLKYNKVPGVKLPDDVESCFKSPDYRRWVSVASKILARASALEKKIDPQAEAEITEEIADLVSNVYSDSTLAELTQIGRGTSRIPPIVVIEEDRDEVGVRHCLMELNDAQYTYFLRKLGHDVQYKLEGEQYDTGCYRLVEYRIHTQDICTECHARNTRFVDICTECKQSDCVQTTESRSVRYWTSDQWTNWMPLDDIVEAGKNIPDGIFDSVLSDLDMRLDYFRQWERVDET